LAILKQMRALHPRLNGHALSGRRSLKHFAPNNGCVRRASLSAFHDARYHKRSL